MLTPAETLATCPALQCTGGFPNLGRTIYLNNGLFDEEETVEHPSL